MNIRYHIIYNKSHIDDTYISNDRLDIDTNTNIVNIA